MWIVIIDKVGKDFDFKEDFFPRVFMYKYEAKQLVEEVEFKGGKAHIEKEPK